MELKQLRYFCAVAEVEHFGRAAAASRIAQPALSRQIRKLERELGIELFERRPRGVRLTASGHLLFAEVKRLLADAEDIFTRTRAAGRGDVGTLRVGVNESASSRGHMVSAIIQFRTRYPNVVLELQHMTSLNQLDALTNRVLDAAFIYHYPEDRADLSHLLVENTSIVLALPDNHRLVHPDRIRLRDIAGEPMAWIRRSVAPATHDVIMRACLEADFSPTVVQEATNEPMALSLVSVGGLLSFVTETNLERRPGNVVLRRVVDLQVEFSLHLAWRSADSSPVLRRFVETVANTSTGVGA